MDPRLASKRIAAILGADRHIDVAIDGRGSAYVALLDAISKIAAGYLDFDDIAFGARHDRSGDELRLFRGERVWRIAVPATADVAAIELVVAELNDILRATRAGRRLYVVQRDGYLGVAYTWEEDAKKLRGAGFAVEQPAKAAAITIEPLLRVSLPTTWSLGVPAVQPPPATAPPSRALAPPPAPALPRRRGSVFARVKAVARGRYFLTDAESVDAAADYLPLVARIAKLAGGTLAFDAVTCTEAAGVRTLTLRRGERIWRRDLRGDTDWIDEGALCDALNEVLAETGEELRVATFDLGRGQEVGFVCATAAELTELGLARK
jgi:hypothetical protein